jgi:hypothetical protein
MKRLIHIRFAGMESSHALIATAHSFAYGLAWDDSEIIACWVGIHHGPEKTIPGPRYSVRVDVTVPGHVLTAAGGQFENVYLALDHAFEDMERQLAGIDPRINHGEYAVTIPGMLLPLADLAEKRR